MRPRGRPHTSVMTKAPIDPTQTAAHRIDQTSLPAQAEAMVFSSFRVDRRSGQLTRSGVPVALRPKTWAVLVYLAERPGVLVSTDELLDAV